LDHQYLYPHQTSETDQSCDTENTATPPAGLKTVEQHNIYNNEEARIVERGLRGAA
jgi:hypothetical protein